MQIGVWNYPEGGRHENVTKQALPYQAFGLTVSLGSRRRNLQILKLRARRRLRAPSPKRAAGPRPRDRIGLGA